MDGIRIMFPGKPDHLDDRMRPGPVSACDLVHRCGHVVQQSGKWSTVPVHPQKLDHFPPESRTRSHRNHWTNCTGIRIRTLESSWKTSSCEGASR